MSGSYGVMLVSWRVVSGSYGVMLVSWRGGEWFIWCNAGIVAGW